MLIKVLAEEVALNSATNVSTATVVRVYNGNSSNVVITRTDASDTTIGSLTLKNGESVVLEKEPTDKLVSSSTSTAVKGVKIAFRN